MGYEVKVSAKLPEKLTPLERAIRSIQSLEALEILGKLLQNAAVSPKEEKFRRIRLTNPKIDATLVQVPGCLEALQHMGWIMDEADKEFLMIQPGTYMSMKEVRLIEDQKDRVRREASRRKDYAPLGAATPSSVQVQA